MKPADKSATVAAVLDTCPNERRHHRLFDGMHAAAKPASLRAACRPVECPA
jgi:hypothetical protein